MYLNENKKRIQKWFQACGIQVPLGETKFGFIRSISQNSDSVNRDFSARTPDDVSFTSRSLLADALESTAQNEAEKEKLAEYKGRIDMLNAEEKKLAQLKGELKELTFGKGEKCNNIFTFYDFLLKKIKKCSIINMYYF